MSNLAGRIAFQFYQRFLVLQLGGLIFLGMQYVINKLLHVKSLVSFSFTRFQYHTAHSIEDSLVRDMVLKTRE